MASQSSLKMLSSVRAFGGHLKRFEHCSAVLGNLQMKFAVFIPDQAGSTKLPTLYYLSGLTCTDENVSQKGTIGFKYASELGIAIVMPDTSPRGHEEIKADEAKGIIGENDSWDFGTGAGFYLNATKEPYNRNYKMYDYVTKELPSLMQTESEFSSWYQQSNISITGHSMGGHGALTIGLKNPETYKSISAFAPICNPTQVPWGKKAFKGYLANPSAEQSEYDALELIKAGRRHPNSILIDQGTGDNFYKGDVNQLTPEVFRDTCAEKGQPAEVNLREGYDHSYYFISSFWENHLKHHKKYFA